MKRLFTISALGFFLLAALVFIYLLNPSFLQKAKEFTGKIPNVVTSKKASLSLRPAEVSGIVGKSVTLSVEIDTGGLKVSGAQFSLNYDPRRIEVESLKVGNFFERPTTLLNRSNRATGNYEFALGSLTPKSGKGSLVEVSVKLLTSGDTTLLEFSSGSKIAAVELGNTNAGDKFLPAKISIKQ